MPWLVTKWEGRGSPLCREARATCADAGASGQWEEKGLGGSEALPCLGELLLPGLRRNPAGSRKRVMLQRKNRDVPDACRTNTS